MKRENRKIDLDGIWEFAVDNDEKTWAPSGAYDRKIRVPYCPESRLSGLEYRGEIRRCRYRKNFQKPPLGEAERLFLHVGACDYQTFVFLNGKFVGEHRGGYTPFELDLTAYLQEENALEFLVRDDMREEKPSGKQTKKERPFGCFYTRVTGIWQNVFLEVLPRERVTGVRFYPDPDACRVNIELTANAVGEAEITVFYEGRKCGEVKAPLAYRGTFSCRLCEKHLWEVGRGRCYDVAIRFQNDEVRTYFGLRKVEFGGGRFLLNGKSVFQRLVLDQGYYEGGIYTPESEKRFEEDIKAALKLGFNGARLHQKVFPPKYLEIADRYGFLVWGEFPGWGISYRDTRFLGSVLGEWRECIERDFNHPSIVCWCPLNEVWNDGAEPEIPPDTAFCECLYQATKLLDPTRPCVDTSGGFHGRFTDLFDFHCYESAETLKGYISALDERDELQVKLLYPSRGEYIPYRKGQAVNVSEFGGISFGREDRPPVKETWLSEEDWGYGRGESDETLFVERYRELAETIMSSGKISGFCYTQLYDVEQEKNGLYFFDRRSKFSLTAMRTLCEINSRRAECEKDGF